MAVIRRSADGILIFHDRVRRSADGILIFHDRVRRSADGILIFHDRVRRGADGILIFHDRVRRGADGILIFHDRVRRGADGILIFHDRVRRGADGILIFHDRGSQRCNSGLGSALPTDQAVLVAFCPNFNLTIFNTNAGKRSDASASLDVSSFLGETIETWIAFITAGGVNASNSFYTGELALS